jgi:hypothetical protein
MAKAARPVFISYARLDQPVVSRAVEFLRGGGLNVFVDSQSIAYGTDWRQALGEAIENAERVMLFWTASAAVSHWVTQEWQFALKCGKKVVPTLLDETPLPPALACLQSVTTLRGLFPAPAPRAEDLLAEQAMPHDASEVGGWNPRTTHSGQEGSNPPPTWRAPTPFRKAPYRLRWIVATLAVIGVVSLLSLATLQPASDMPDLTQAPSDSTIPSQAGQPASAVASEPALLDAVSLMPVFILMVLVAAILLFLWRYARTARARAIVKEVYSR